MSQSNQYLLSSSTSIHVVSSGSALETTPTLIFLHFWGGSFRTFSTLTSYLSPKYHTVAVDFRGWGLSTGPQDSTAYTIKDLAADIESLIPKLHLKEFFLVGHSMGGKVAQLMAGRNLVPGLKGVVLLGPAPPTPFELPPDMKAQQIGAYSSPQSAEFVTRNVLSSSPLSDETVAVLVADMLKGTEFARKAWPEYGMAENIVEKVKDISVPVLVISGERDIVEPAEKLKIEVVGNIKGAAMVVIQEKGHLLPVEAPEVVSKYVDKFVKSVLSGEEQ